MTLAEPIARFLLEAAAEADHWVRANIRQDRDCSIRISVTASREPMLTIILSRHIQPEMVTFTWSVFLKELDIMEAGATMWARQVVRKMSRALEEM